MHTRIRHASRGFTLVEAAITVAIVAIAAGLVIPAMHSVSRADLRTASTLIAGEIKESYSDAVLQGETFRIAFDMGQKKIVVESKRGTAVLSDTHMEEETEESPSSSLLPSWMGIEPADLSNAKESGSDDVSPAPSLGSFLGLQSPGHSRGGAFQQVRTRTLPEGVRILDVWTDTLEQPEGEGVVYLFLFPHGYTQDALIHLEDEDARNFTVSVDALTGHTSIEEGYTEVPQ
jgi:general secretion pathway protein H